MLVRGVLGTATVTVGDPDCWQIENIAITSPHEAIRIFINKTVAIGEMALFNEKEMVQQRIIELLK